MTGTQHAPDGFDPAGITRTAGGQRAAVVCAHMWTERGDSAFHRAGRTGTYVCVDSVGHRGPHTGRLLGQREGSR